MHIHLRDRSAEVVDAWQAQLGSRADVTISQGDIFDVACDAIVSPANSFGFMDGGIDLVYSRHFGWDLSERLQQKIQADFHGELLVGLATVVPTENTAIPWLISAPTMRVPLDVSGSANAYLAFRAALLAAEAHNGSGADAIETVLCPGLATAVGRMPAARCAYQMHAALLAVAGDLPFPRVLGAAREQDQALRSR
ncbi:MAG: macro domain-containing protein [Proteobacteria bacterium]|nr:macro domain-containing protein [Pseudomonadota bacterium]